MTDELPRLRALRAEDGAPDPAAEARARAALARHIAAAGRTPRRPRRRRWRVPAIALPALAAAAVAVLLVTGGGARDVAPDDAAAALERAAAAARARPAGVPGPGEYLYLRDRTAYLATVADRAPYSYLRPAVRETWVARDGSGRYVERGAGPPVFPGPRDRARWVAAGRPSLGARIPRAAGTLPPRGFPAGASTLSFAELAALPEDGDAMYARLRELAGDAGPSPDVEAFVIIGDLLRSAPVPPAQRAALYRAAARIEGVRLAGAVRDDLGRPGVAVDLEHEGQRRRLVFDPRTSNLLAEQEVLTERASYLDAAPGFPLGSRVVVEQGVVDDVGARPR